MRPPGSSAIVPFESGTNYRRPCTGRWDDRFGSETNAQRGLKALNAFNGKVRGNGQVIRITGCVSQSERISSYPLAHENRVYLAPQEEGPVGSAGR